MPLSMPAVARALMRTTPTLAPVPHRAVLSLAGSQASEFLNGLLASSVADPPRPRFSAFLHAQGRVLYDVFIYTRTNPAGKRGYLLEYDARASDAPPLLPLLKRYVLRSKVKIRDASDEFDVWAAWGHDTTESPRQWDWARSGAVEPVWDPAHQWPWGTEDNVLLDRRAPGMGKRMLVRKGERPMEAAHHDTTTADDYLLHRILHGVPEGALEIPPMHAFPMDSNLDVMGGLDFRKGCYVGQELTVRTYHTGVVRKRILPVHIQKSDNGAPSNTTPVPLNSDIKAHLTQDADSVRPTPRPRGTGKLLSSTHGVGLALLRLEHIEGMQQGLLKFAAETGETGSDRMSWSVTPWWPDWWPPRPSESETGSA